MHASAAPEPTAHGWLGALELGFAAREGRTWLAHRAHTGPLQVQRPFFPEGPEVCHVYLLHPPGGLVAGDALRLRARVGPGAHALITTPAATKLYRSTGATAEVDQRLEVEPGAALEWLPQETIAFDGARASLSTRIDLASDARFIGWELLCLGRPAGNAPFATGRCRQRLELYRNGRPVALEWLRLEAGGPEARAPWGLGGRTVGGTLLASPAPHGGASQPDAALLEPLRELAARLPAPDLASATLLDGALCCRYLGASAERARAHFQRCWALLRPALLERPPHPPRIWLT